MGGRTYLAGACALAGIAVVGMGIQPISAAPTESTPGLAAGGAMAERNAKPIKLTRGVFLVSAEGPRRFWLQDATVNARDRVILTRAKAGTRAVVRMRNDKGVFRRALIVPRGERDFPAPATSSPRGTYLQYSSGGTTNYLWVSPGGRRPPQICSFCHSVDAIYINRSGAPKDVTYGLNLERDERTELTVSIADGGSFHFEPKKLPSIGTGLNLEQVFLFQPVQPAYSYMAFLNYDFGRPDMSWSLRTGEEGGVETFSENSDPWIMDRDGYRFEVRRLTDSDAGHKVFEVTVIRR